MRHPALIAVLLPIAVAAIALPAWAVLVVKPGTEQLQSLADRRIRIETDRAAAVDISEDLKLGDDQFLAPLQAPEP